MGLGHQPGRTQIWGPLGRVREWGSGTCSWASLGYPPCFAAALSPAWQSHPLWAGLESMVTLWVSWALPPGPGPPRAFLDSSLTRFLFQCQGGSVCPAKDCSHVWLQHLHPTRCCVSTLEQELNASQVRHVPVPRTRPAGGGETPLEEAPLSPRPPAQSLHPLRQPHQSRTPARPQKLSPVALISSPSHSRDSSVGWGLVAPAYLALNTYQAGARACSRLGWGGAALQKALKALP